VLENKLSVLTESLDFIGSELVLLTSLLLFLILDLMFVDKAYRVIYLLSLLVTCLVVYLAVQQLTPGLQGPVPLFLNMLELNHLSISWKVILDLGLLLSLLVHLRSEQPKFKVETIVMFFAITIGAHLLVMSSNLLMAYLSIELMSIAAYVMTTYGLKANSYESAIKYLLFGGVSSAIMIYGISMIYAFTGTLQFSDPIFIEKLLEVNTFSVGAAGVMILLGILFKLSAAPMHVWAPDVYQLAPTPVVNFFSLVPKIAGLAFVITWIMNINLFGLGEINWPQIIGFIAVASLVVGNFSALWQANVKRMLAYSSIAQSGFLLLGLAAFSETGLNAIVFYSIIYLVMNTGAFLLVQYFENKFDAYEFKDYKGLIKQSPYLGVLFLIVLISLTGLPPTAGFMAKLFIFSALWEFYATTGQSWIIFIFAFGLLNVVIALIYYLKIPYFMIFKESPDSKVYEISIFENFLATILVVIIFVLFFKPEWLMNMINSVNFAL